MLKRKNFLKCSGALALGGLFMPNLFAQTAGTNVPPVNRLGVGLFTLPKQLENDFAGTLKMIAGIGYKEVEFFGPFSFSTKEDIESWKGAASMLGFSGSGFYGRTAKEVKKILDDNGLSAPSIHAGLLTLQQRMDSLAEAAQALGTTYVVLPSATSPADLDGYKRQAEMFNEIGASAAKHGLRFAYHNHGNGLKELNGKMPLELILEGTDPKLVYFQMDLFWTTAGGLDPVTLLKRHPGRYRSLHIKDMSKAVRFSGDGSDPAQWFELFPYLTDAGSGVMDLKTILSQAQQAGVEHYFVERDLAPNAQEALEKAYHYLSSLKNESKK
jgi:sugar phosphate isomerase/epimerase